MKLRLMSLLISMLYLSVTALSQNKKTIITADISGFTGKLPVSQYTEWQGDDTLVPAVINYHAPGWDAMGSEYLIFSNDGNTMDPKNDSAPGGRQKIWRKKASTSNTLYTWVLEIDQPRTITNESLLGGTYLILAGDSIHITFNQSTPLFSGRGAAKFQIAYQVKAALKSIEFPDKKRDYTSAPDIERYLMRNKYLDEQINKGTAILDANRSMISQFEYDWLKGTLLASTENNRWLYFIFPWQAKMKNPKLPYSMVDLIAVWDTTMYRPEARWFRSAAIQNMPGISSAGYTESFHTIEIRRKFNFTDHDSVTNNPIFKKQLYHILKSTYTGLYRERLLCYFLAEEIIQEMMAPYNWFAKSIMNDYYNTPGFPSYKSWMKALEKSKEDRYAGVSSAGTVPLFNLKDNSGSAYTQNHTDGKVTIINFWYSGCEPCKQSAKNLNKLQEKYRNDSCVIFLHISVDADKKQWEKSIKEGIFVPKEGIQLYTGGLGKKHEMLRDFNVTEIPTIRMYDNDGRIFIDPSNPFAHTISDHQLDTIIGSQLVRLKDGPYVFSKDGETKIYTIHNAKVTSLSSGINLTSATDRYDKQVIFPLQKQLAVPPTTYSAPSKMLVLSDIEGNFAAFRKLLQVNQVIDEHFNWTFNNGHLVLAGDMFDRGEQVTECLWLIYSLEEKARAAGGWVHFILGNHEIMNLSGTDKYVVEKYKINYSLLGKTLRQVYGEDSELGRWLRTKNVVEKIGNNLFCHGGISSELNQLSLSLEEINTLARPWYAEYRKDYGNEKVNIIMSSSLGPFWYRGYYKGSPVENLVDSTLQQFNVNHIVTGHTIVADTISTHFDGKVINTDTRHAAGKSEALLIENNHYFRVSHTGRKTLLFKENDELANIHSTRKH